jgi:hypothetical protein
MANKWLRHLANFREKNQNVPAEQVMKQARASYQSGGNPKGPMPLMKPHTPSAVKPDGAPHTKPLKGGNVVPYERSATESTPSKVGGKRRTRRQSRKSRRTRRR